MNGRLTDLMLLNFSFHKLTEQVFELVNAGEAWRNSYTRAKKKKLYKSGDHIRTSDSSFTWLVEFNKNNVLPLAKAFANSRHESYKTYQDN